MFAISVPLPGLDVASVKELKKLLTGMEKASQEGPVRGGVVSEGEAAAYALVWEFGNARQTKKGPKTTLGIGPDGEEVWLSIQAPMGYLRIHESEYVRMLEDELAAVDLGDLTSGKEIRQALKQASRDAGHKIAELIREYAPRDTGALESSIQAADPDDADLEAEDEEIELGGNSFAHRGLQKALRDVRKRIK